MTVENHGGAGVTLAEVLLAKSAPDGYTLMMSGDSVPANPRLFPGWVSGWSPFGSGNPRRP